MENNIIPYEYIKSSSLKIIELLREFGYIIIRYPAITEMITHYRFSMINFMSLSEDERMTCTPEDFDRRGWSYGKEIFNGKKDDHL